MEDPLFSGVAILGFGNDELENFWVYFQFQLSVKNLSLFRLFASPLSKISVPL
jgi:hypothetical protein